MNIEKKQQIDNIWQNTKVKDIFDCYLTNDEKRVKEMYDEVDYYWCWRGGVSAYILEECKGILDLVKDYDEWLEYLDEVARDNPKLWEAFYVTHIFDEIEKSLLKRNAIVSNL